MGVLVKLDFEPTDGFQVVEWKTPDEDTYESPLYIAKDPEGEPLFFHWFNTVIRTFENAPWASHLDLVTDKGEVGVAIEPDLMEAFRRNKYPELKWHIVDPASVKFLGLTAYKLLDNELDDLLGPE